MSFQEWKSELNELFEAAIGLSTEDIEDYCWYDLYEDGFTPEEAFKEWKTENIW
jgi:hypothetical protein